MTQSFFNPFNMGLSGVMSVKMITLTLLIALDCSSMSSVQAQSQGDLCFLSDGSSSETFTINEAVPIGSIIGHLKVSWVAAAAVVVSSGLFHCFSLSRGSACTVHLPLVILTQQ